MQGPENFSFSNRLGERFVFDPVGQCIYCGYIGHGLTDEHTVPNGLGGRHILPKSSCRNCQKTINQFEQYCMRTILANTRAQLKMKSSKKRPEPKRSVKIVKHDGTVVRLYKPISEIPLMVSLPIWPEPFAIAGVEPPKQFDWHQWVYQSREVSAVLRTINACSFLSEVFDNYKFAQMLAKIAHSHSVALLGLNGFKPWLPELILNQRKPYIYWVGGQFEQLPVEAQRTMALSFGTRLRATDNIPLGVVSIRMFPNLGGPTYHIVIGEMLKHWPTTPTG